MEFEVSTIWIGVSIICVWELEKKLPAKVSNIWAWVLNVWEWKLKKKIVRLSNMWVGVPYKKKVICGQIYKLFEKKYQLLRRVNKYIWHNSFN